MTEDEKDLGVCLIDFGAGTMDIMVYINGALRFSKVIPYAGNRVTDDIAYACATSRMEAESIKVNHGSAFSPPKHHADKKIEVSSIGGRGPRILTRDQLSKVTSARYKELLGLVKNELLYLKADLDSKNMRCELIAGIVITGGGAQIDDLRECAVEVFGDYAQVRIGSPLNITGLTDYVNKPQYATVIGLLQYEHSNEDEGPINEEHSGSGFLSACGNVMKKIFNKVRSEF